MIVTNWTGVEVRLLRTEALRRTQREFSALSGFSLAVIRKWEGRGRSITLAGEFAEGMDTLFRRLTDEQRARFQSALSSNRNGLAMCGAGENPSRGMDPRQSLDPAAVRRLRSLICDLNESYGSEPSTSLLAQAGQYLGQVQIFQMYAATEPIRRELLAVEAHAATFMSRLVWDASQRRDNSTANHYIDQAVAAARNLGDPIAEGQALLRKCYVALYGEKNPTQGMRLTKQVVDTSRRASSELASMALLHQAEAFAMLGHEFECEKALSEADSCFENLDDNDYSLGMYSPGQRGRLAGSCYLSLGKAKQAQSILEHTAHEVHENLKTEAIIVGNLGLAYVRQHALDEAAATLHRAIDLLEETRGGAGLNIVFSACREMQPFRMQPVIRDVYDRVLSLMATT